MDERVGKALWKMFFETGDPLYLSAKYAIEHKEGKRKGR